MAKPHIPKSTSNKFFYSILGICGFAFIGSVGSIMKNLEAHSSSSHAPQPGNAIVAQASPDGELIAEPYKIKRPSEPYATYLVHSVVKIGGSKVSAINSRSSDQTGIWFTHRRYDCAKGKLFTVGGGETLDGINRSNPDPGWSGLIEGSSATQVAHYACSAAGMTLQNTE